VLAREYNITSPEGEMRFKRLHPTRTEFNFAITDPIINFASSNGMKVRGYPLVVDYDLPEWLTKGNFSSNEISSILKEYVQTILRNYSGRVYAWDTVIGVFDDLGKMRQTIWQKAIGPNYVEQIFRWAREADPLGKLFLFNDYSFYPLGLSSNATYDLVSRLRAGGVPIDGIAIASMSLLERMPSYQDVAENMKRLAALGLELHVDHFEISVPLPASEQNLQRQAAAYHGYLSTCLAVATCKAFLTWGFTDRNAWAPNRWAGKGPWRGNAFRRRVPTEAGLQSHARRSQGSANGCALAV
jgi:endo-1,4-beta-xylanase